MQPNTDQRNAPAGTARSRVLHVAFGFFPDPIGGTEIYVQALAGELRRFGWDSVIAAPGDADAAYDWAGVAVRRFASDPALPLTVIYGLGDPGAASAFGRLLDTVSVDLVHFHALTAAASARAMQEAAQRGIPVMLTYHTPTVSCVRGSMMRWGAEPCGGLMEARTCTACALHGKGLPKPVSRAIACLPPGPLASLGRALRPGRTATALQLPSLTRERHSATRMALQMPRRVIAVCDWAADVLRCNGLTSPQLALCRQGVSHQKAPHVTGRVAPQSAARAVRLAYFGRIDPNKGLDVLFRAMQLIPSAPIELDVYGVGLADPIDHNALPFPSGGGDARVRILSPVDNDLVASAMSAYDLLVVPSQWLETGPLVVYEARAAGVPVLGSRLGGIAELVRDDVDGKLVEPGSPRAWADAILSIVNSPELITRWKGNLRAPRSMADVARECADLYRACLAEAPSMKSRGQDGTPA